jgi:hypothetical protein
MEPIPNLTQAEEQSLPFRLGGDAYFKHCHMAGMGKLRGRGFFGDFWNAGKQFASNVVERVKQTGESIVNVVRGKAPRLDFSPRVRQLLQDCGNRPIVRMFVRRDPIESAINTALNVISMGSWNSLKQKYGYDTITGAFETTKLNKHDWVVASGVFTQRRCDTEDKDLQKLFKDIELLYDIAGSVVAFNLLSPINNQHHEGFFYVHPGLVMDMLIEKYRYVTVRHNYANDVYTVLIYKF